MKCEMNESSIQKVYLNLLNRWNLHPWLILKIHKRFHPKQIEFNHPDQNYLFLEFLSTSV